MTLPELNPDLTASLIVLLTAIGGWLWRKAKGEKQQDFRELLDETITAEVVDALEDDTTAAALRGRLEGAASALDKKLGVTLPKAMVTLAVTWGETEFRRMMQERKAQQAIPGQLKDLAVKAEKVLEAFTPKGDMPKLDIDVEIIK